MIELNIPGITNLIIEHAIFDMNGTLSENGLITGQVKELLNELSNLVTIQIITSDTFGNAHESVKGINAELKIISGNNSAQKKKELVYKLGYSGTVVIGNGYNDHAMFKQGVIGIGIIGNEGLAVKAALHCDIIVNSIENAIGLLLNPKKLIATLRN